MGSKATLDNTETTFFLRVSKENPVAREDGGQVHLLLILERLWKNSSSVVLFVVCSPTEI